MENENNSNLAMEKKVISNEQQPNYFHYIIQSIKDPNTILSHDFKGYHQFGLINMIIFLGLILLSSFIGLLDYLDALEWFGFGDYFNYLGRTLSFAIAIVIVIPVFVKVAASNGSKFHMNYFLEKFGAFFILPSILLLVSLPLEALGITVSSWFSSLATTFLYIGVFMTSYLYVSRNNMKTAFIFVAGFYFVYRLLLMIL
ncbi:hypothetical protein [Ornithinibacillus xuwenensis]|uniref:Yip1 domain-containing protein n=1 Tax=Ornithinibacillus xuwenensis TaxID=3144668 RepID=A0ABU9XKI8_9BACI